MTDIIAILKRAQSGIPLSSEEGLALLEAPDDLHPAILEAAGALRRKLHGDRATYVINRNLCSTNICYIGCKFCNFAVGRNDPEAFFVNEADVREKLGDRPDFTEVCMQGGIDPDLDLEGYTKLLDMIRAENPDIHIHAFSAEEIHYACKKSGWEPQQVLARFKEHGLDSLPGTAAEIFHPEIRQRLCPEKIDAQRWFEIHRASHNMGIPSSATMLFGHIERPEHIIDHMDRVLALQAETGGFTEFVPLLFVHLNTKMRDWDGLTIRRGPEAHERYIERVYAVCRLYLGEAIPHLQTSWVKLGVPKALWMMKNACDDFGGCLYEERITSTAGGTNGDRIEPEDIVRHLREAGFEPQQRTTTYGVIT